MYHDYVADSSLDMCHGALRINVASQERRRYSINRPDSLGKMRENVFEILL